VCIRDGSMFHCRRCDATSSPVVVGPSFGYRESPRKEVSQVERGRFEQICPFGFVNDFAKDTRKIYVLFFY